MKSCLCFLLVSVLSLLTVSRALAAPVNDNAASATAITGAITSISGSNLGATKESGEGDHAGNRGGASVWYSWNPPPNTPVSINTFGSAIDTLLEVYVVFGGNRFLFGLSDDARGGLQSEVTFTTIDFAGISYLIVVDGYNAGTTPLSASMGDFKLNIAATPTVTMTAPAAGASFIAGTNITLSANATAPRGSAIREVTFYAGNDEGFQIIGVDTTPPYSVVWSNVPAGDFQVAAAATDTNGFQGFSTTAPAISIVSPDAVSVTLLPARSNWRFFDRGTDLGTAWRARNYDDSGWTNGPGPLGYGDPHIRTAVSFGGNPNARFIATYFRRELVVTNASAFAAMIFRLLRDDGVVIYINSNEVSRINLPQGPINFQTTAQASIGGADETNYVRFNISPGSFVNGTNLIAVEVHQQAPNSSDLGFDLEIVGSIAAGVRLVGPPNGVVFNAPATIPLVATASAARGTVAQVDFYNGDTLLGTATSSPYTNFWTDVPVGEYALRAVSRDSEGGASTSAVVRVSVMLPSPPVIVAVDPPPGAAGDVSAVRVTFSKSVSGVDAADLRLNGVPAAKVSSVDGTNFLFAFAPPSSTRAVVTWATNHNITDLTIRSQPFDTTATNATWSYQLIDRRGPSIQASEPPAGSTVFSLSEITITFTEGVLGLDAADLLINGVPATSVRGSNDAFTFSFPQPTLGEVAVSWRPDHGITDLISNRFDHTTATWRYTLEAPRVTLVRTNSLWRWTKGLAEASQPVNAWRLVNFNDSAWEEAPSVFYYGEEWPVGTLIPDMINNYSCIFLRQKFVLTNAAQLANLRLRAECDDGFIVWLNGVEVQRYNMPAGDVAFNGFASGAVQEQGIPSVPFITFPLDEAQRALVNGTNVITVQAFNNALTSSDLVIDVELTATVTDPALVAPTLATVDPEGEDVTSLERITVSFSEPVQGVNASDLLLNGRPATGLTETNGFYTFTFAQPPFGPVEMTWATNHGIVDFDMPPRAFDGMRASRPYRLINANAPFITSRSPAPDTTVGELTEVTVTWSRPVAGVDAADLLINGATATNVTGSGATRTFQFRQPSFGNVFIRFRPNADIVDAANSANVFDPAAPGAFWNVTVRDVFPPVVVARIPPAGARVTALAQVRIRFSEPVQGVDASDLLINGIPATRVTGSDSNYTFNFTQPSPGPVRISWSPLHGINDLAATANPFNPAAPGSTWEYTLIDVLPPSVTATEPAPGGTVRALTRVTVTFSEDVGGVDASDLLINGSPATRVNGSRRGPYDFEFAQPPTGAVQIAWVTNSGIHDFASPPNPFAGGTWSYTLDTNVNAAVVVINEIMYHPSSENDADEWIELLNTGASALNITGWRFSRGVNIVFPAGTLGAGEYLVVAANVAAFTNKYPTVRNVIGGWRGALSNSREEIELEDAAGDRVDRVIYSDEGDWGIRQRGPLDRQTAGRGFYGWEWFAQHDGLGSSLELANPRLDNNVGQNWKASLATDGTPGRANSVATRNLAPMILDVTHSPAVPHSTDTITITARVADEDTRSLLAQLNYRDHSTLTPPDFTTIDMFDDGRHGDGAARDGVFGAILPAQPNHTVIEFFVWAQDGTDRTNTWPAPAGQTNLVASQDGQIFAQTANALLQVDDEVYPGKHPIHRLIMTETERAELEGINRQSDAQMNGTLVTVDGTSTKIRYLCGIRIRGAGSRGAAVPNYRVNIPGDVPWNGVTALNHNAQYGFAQVVGSALAQKAGLVAANARTIQVRVNGRNLAFSDLPQYGNYALLEPFNGDWAENHLPTDSEGNIYRASTGAHSANFADRGTDPQAYINAGFTKVSNTSQNDWSDLIRLCQTLNTNDEQYVQAVRATVNVEEWMRYFAVFSMLVSMETSLGTGRGDDYALYSGITDPRFTLLPHDFDTILGEGDTPGATNTALFRMINPPNPNANVPQMFRFLRHPEFVPLYYGELKRLAETLFTEAQINPLIDQLIGEDVPTFTLESMKRFARDRATWVLGQIPTRLTINGEGATITASNRTITLTGQANVIDTRIVRVNGIAATWEPADRLWTANNVQLAPGVNRVLVQAFDAADNEIDRRTVEVFYDDGSVAMVTGPITTNTTWTAAGGPYQISTSLTVERGATLRIEEGTTVYLDAGVNLVVANGGQLIAEGTDTRRVRFTRPPGSSGRWGGITINGSIESPETRIAYAHLEFNGTTAIHADNGTVFLDHLTFGSTDRQYVSLDGSAFVVSHCEFPSATTPFELVHGTRGIKSGGVGVFVHNFFGKPIGYNDTVDFTGGNRPGPIVEFINNVFVGSDDDILDLDSTDAWVEGNIFLGAHRNGSPDSSSAVSGGADNADTSEITILGNLFFDVDHVANAKQGNFYTLLNNTIVRQTRVGGVDDDAGVVTPADNGTEEGRGFYLEANIIVDAEKLVRTQNVAQITFTNNFMTLPWTGPGGGNSSADPKLKHIPTLAEVASFTNWASAQVMRDWFSLAPDSPARGVGPNGRDAGGVIPRGISISGEPSGTTPRRDVLLFVDGARTGNGIPNTPAGFPNGSGYTHYIWRLDGGPWNLVQSVSIPIQILELPNGPHTVEAAGIRDSGTAQNDPVNGDDATTTSSRTWIVDTARPALRINEVLARNLTAVNHAGAFPDLVELFNAGGNAVDLAGLRLTDEADTPNKFVFPANTTLGPGEYLVLYADTATSAGLHLGFALNSDGDELFLFDRESNGGALLDSVEWGAQLADVSIGRVNAGWALTRPTFGAANAPAPVGDPRALRINEWLADGRSPFAEDFIELYNANSLPVNLGGFFLSDEPVGWPTRHPIRALSFIAGGGFLVFDADANAGAGPTHLNFRLAPEQGFIALFQLGTRNSELGTGLAAIDCVFYGPQRTDVSFGRSPNGGSNLVFFPNPTPGSVNPSPGTTNLAAVVLNEVFANNATRIEADGSTPDAIELFNPSNRAVNVGDMSLTDDISNTRRYVIPAGTTIAAGGYLTFRCDGNAPASASNTGFGLSAGGGAVYFYDKPANGGAPIGSVAFGVQAADFSLGRIPNGTGEWALTLPTLGARNLAAQLGNPANLKINEWMASPATGDDWFEVFNPDPQPVALGGLHLTDNLNNATKFVIAPLSFIGAGLFGYQRFEADNNPGLGPNHVNFGLAAGGEALGIANASGATIHSLRFGAQARGVSQGSLPDGSTNIVSFAMTATPGEGNYLPITDVVINEVLTHTDPPFEDAIELRNVSINTVNLGGWFVSDTRNNLRKFRILDRTTLAPGAFAVLYENQFNPIPGDPGSFSLNSARGDEVWLSAADTNGTLTGFRANVKFGAAENGVSFGRVMTSVGFDFAALNERTFGADSATTVEAFRMGMGLPNTGPRVGPVVFAEIHYHPPDGPGGADNATDEFIELRNVTSAPVPLHDPARTTNTWRLRDGVEFDFPTGFTLGANATVVVVSFDPANAAALSAFRTRFGLGTGVTIVGPYSGKLDNGGESLDLLKPDAPQLPPDPDAGYVPYVLVERVSYSDRAPWPAAADGTGDSLQRRSLAAYGNDPANWTSGPAAPGQVMSNQPPVLTAIPDRTIPEGRLVTVLATATDPDAGQTLNFDLGPGAPEGATITARGLLRWRPQENQGPGRYPITIRVTDSGTPPASATTTFTLTVEEVNAPPYFVNTLDKYVNAGGTLSFLTAADADIPAQTLAYSLAPNSLANLSLDPATGRLTWSPSSATPPGVYHATVNAADNGTPPLTSSFTYSIHVAAPGETVIVAEVRHNGSNVVLVWNSVPGKTYAIQSTRDLNPATWVNAVTGRDLSPYTAPLTPEVRYFRVLQLD